MRAGRPREEVTDCHQRGQLIGRGGHSRRVELVVRAAGARLEPVEHRLLVDRVECPVAPRAAGVGRQRRREAVEDVAQLLRRLGTAHVRAGVQRASAQQSPVPGEQRPRLGVGERDELVVLRVVAVGGVHAEQAQAPGQDAQVHVEQQTRRGGGQRLGPGHGLDLDRLTKPGPVRRGRLARLARCCHPQCADLGERHPEGLDEVAQGGRAVPAGLDVPAAVPGGQEQAQPGGEAQVHEHADSGADACGL